MIVADTSFMYALLDRNDNQHSSASNWYLRTDETVCTTSLVIAEIDYLVNSRLGSHATKALYKDVSDGAYLIQGSQDIVLQAIEIASKYSSIGLTDASLVIVAAEFNTNVIATFDENHFRMIKPITKHEHFVLAPIDM